MVTHRDTLAGADLELPLRWHDLSVDAADVDARVEASAVMSFNQITGKDLAGSGTTVIGALRTREPTLGPGIGLAIDVKQSVLLFKTKPRLLVFSFVHDLLGMMTEVRPVGSAVAVVGLCEDKDVVTAAEGIFEDGCRTKVDIGVIPRGLVGGRTIKVPNAQLANICDLLADSLQGKRHLDDGVFDFHGQVRQPSFLSEDHHPHQSRHLPCIV